MYFTTHTVLLIYTYIYMFILYKWCVLLLFIRWSTTPVEQRSTLLMKIADLIEARLDEFAEVESRDQGKPVWLAKRIDIPRLIHNFRYFASYSLHDLNM